MHVQHKIDDLNMVVIKDDTITHLERRLDSGVSKNGVAWKRYRLQAMQTWSWRSGYLNRYNKSRKPGHIKGMPLYSMNMMGVHFGSLAAELSVFQEAIINRLGVAPVRGKFGLDWSSVTRETWAQQYPLLRDNLNWTPRPGMARLLRAESLQEGTRQYFGSTRYRRDLVKAIAGSSLHQVSHAHEFRGLVPVDWIITNLRDTHAYQDATRAVLTTHIRPLLTTLNLKTLRRLLADNPNSNFTVRDSVRLFDLIREVDSTWSVPGNFTTWTALHDYLTREQRKLKERNQTIEPGEIAKKLHGATIDTLSIQTARDTHQLVDWGAAMSNCIGGYGRSATNGSTNLFGIYDGGVLIGNMEVSNEKAIRQLVGKFNAKLPEKQDKLIRILVRETIGSPSTPTTHIEYAYNNGGLFAGDVWNGQFANQEIRRPYPMINYPQDRGINLNYQVAD